MKIRGRLEGADQIIARLGNVSRAVKNKLLRKSVNAATMAPYKASRANAKNVVSQVAAGDELGQAMKSTGTLAKSIGRKVKIYRESGVAVGIVGPRQGFRRTVTLKSGRQLVMDPVKYSHLVELGTRRSRAKPFLRTAWESTKGEAENALVSTMRDGIAEAAK